MQATQRTLLTAAGFVLLAIGVTAMVVASWNLSADMDRADRTGEAGDMFAMGVAPLGLAGFVAMVVGLALLAVIAIRRARV